MSNDKESKTFKGFEYDDFAIGNLVEVDIPAFPGQYVIVGNRDPALLTLREVTAESGRGKPFKIGRAVVKVTHLSIPAALIEQRG